MATKAEYSEQLLPLLATGLRPQLLSVAPAGAEAFDLEAFSNTLGGILEELEKQHLGAAGHMQSLLAEKPVAPWDGHGELAFLLYYLHHPPVALREEIDARPALKLVWDAMAAVAAPSPITPAAFSALGAALPARASVKCNKWGDIYGTGKYEQLDPGWAWTLKNVLMNHMPKWLGKGFGIAGFVVYDWQQPVKLTPLGSGAGEVRIAIIGDWGAGKYPLPGLPGNDGPACAVMDTLGSLPQPPDYLVHLGDTYYSGTGPNRSPRNEEAHQLLEILRLYPQLARPGRCFTLNSNHEMYGGAYGYFDVALADPLFGSQMGCSYFALEYGDWIIAGVDSAYFDPSVLYMDGGLGGVSADAQYAFLERLEDTGKRVIVMTHHTGMSTDGSQPSRYLWDDIHGVLKPDCWYWGHTHLGIAYSSSAYSASLLTRCIGHGAMPFAIPPGMAACRQNVDWYSDTPLDPLQALQASYYARPRAKNGFAVLTLSDNGIREEIYDIGNVHAVWSR